MRLVQAGSSAVKVATDLDLTETALRAWVKQAEADEGVGDVGVLTTDERNELARLRRENNVLRQEREILKAAAVNSIGRRNTSNATSSDASGSSGA